MVTWQHNVLIFFFLLEGNEQNSVAYVRYANYISMFPLTEVFCLNTLSQSLKKINVVIS